MPMVARCIKGVGIVSLMGGFVVVFLISPNPPMDGVRKAEGG